MGTKRFRKRKEKKFKKKVLLDIFFVTRELNQANEELRLYFNETDCLTAGSKEYNDNVEKMNDLMCYIKDLRWLGKEMFIGDMDMERYDPFVSFRESFNFEGLIIPPSK